MTLSTVMDRRDVLKLVGATGIVSFVPRVVLSSVPARAAAPMVVLADPRYHNSSIFAKSLERYSAKRLLLVSDRARLWSQSIEPELRCGLQYLAGLTLESDLFVLDRLAEGSGARASYVGFHDWRCQEASAHTLSGSILLDPIAASLAAGERNWAERLGQALVSAKELCQEEYKLTVSCTIPAGHGPRFFVSWLMRWRA